MTAAAAVVAISAAAPWAFGCTDPWWSALLAAACLVATSLAFVRGAFGSGRPDALPRPLVVAALLVAVPPLLGLVPVPAWLHRILVPAGSALLDAVGDEPGWRTISLRFRSTLDAATLAGAYVGAFLLVARAARSPAFRAVAAAVLCATGAALAAAGIFFHLRPTDPPTIYGTFPIYEVATPFGPYVNRNHFAGAMEVLAGIAAGEMLSATAERRRAAAVASGVCLAAMLVALVATLSRGGLLGAGAGAAFLLATQPRARRLRIVLASAAGLALLAGLAAATGWLDGLLRGIFRVNPRWSVRFAVQGDALLAFAGNPFLGTGAGTFESVFPAFHRVRDLRAVGDAHSDPAQLLMETGLAGAAVAVTVVRRLVRCLAEGVRRGGPGRWRVLGPAAGAVGIVAHGFVDVNLHVPANALLTVVALSLACAAALGPVGDPAPAPEPAAA